MFLIIYLFFILFNLNLSILKIPFKVNLTYLTNNLQEKEFMFYFSYNSIYTYININSINHNIPINIKLQKNPFYILSSDCLDNNEEEDVDKYFTYKSLYYFNQTLSSTFYSKEKDYKVFIEEDFDYGKISSDKITFNNLNSMNFSFVLVSKFDKYKNIFNGGSFGLSLNYKKDEELINTNLIKQLKLNNIINSYLFTLEFSNEKFDEGNLILDFNVSDKKFDKIEAIHEILNVFWGIKIEKISFFNNNEEIKLNNEIVNIKLFYELNVFIAGINVKYLILNSTNILNLFNEKKCIEKEFNDKTTKLNYFVCNKEIDKNLFGNFSFYQKDLNREFIFNSNDLFEEQNGKLIFLIVFYQYKSEKWEIGLPFFKKYKTLFDFDKKLIFIEKNIDFNDNNNNNNNINILIIFSLIFIIIFILFVFFRVLKKKKKLRKKNDFELNSLEEENNYKTIKS